MARWALESFTHCLLVILIASLVSVLLTVCFTFCSLCRLCWRVIPHLCKFGKPGDTPFLPQGCGPILCLQLSLQQKILASLLSEVTGRSWHTASTGWAWKLAAGQGQQSLHCVLLGRFGFCEHWRAQHLCPLIITFLMFIINIIIIPIYLEVFHRRSRYLLGWWAQCSGYGCNMLIESNQSECICILGMESRQGLCHAEHISATQLYPIPNYMFQLSLPLHLFDMVFAKSLS